MNQDATNELTSTSVQAGSEPVNEVVDTQSAQQADSEPAKDQTAAQNTDDSHGSEPSKAVKDLIAQRKRRQQAEKEAEYWRGVAEAKGFKPEAQPQQPKYEDGLATPPTQPSLEQFETFEEYEKAKDEYLVQQAEYRVAQKFLQYQQQQQQQHVQTTFQEKANKELEVDPYIFDTIQQVGSMVSPVVADLVVQSDDAIALVRYFSSNPQDAHRISRMHPMLAAKELGVIEARIKYTPKPEPPKKVSQAPDPIATLNPVGSVKEFDPETASMDEYYKHRMSQMRQPR